MGKKRRGKRTSDGQPEIATKPPSTLRDRRGVVAAGVAVAVLSAAFLAYKLYVDPRVTYLSGPEQGAQWIRNDERMLLGIYRRREWTTRFSTRFVVPADVMNPKLTVRACRRFEVQLDGVPIFRGSERWDDWKRRHEVPLGDRLAAGSHQLSIVVLNLDGHPCLMASCPELGIRSGSGWVAGRLGDGLRPALLATKAMPPDITRYYPSVADCFAQLAGWLAAIFGLGVAAIWWTQHAAGRGPARWLTPATVRWCLLLAWIVLGANNIWRIPPTFGYDWQGHADYVKFVAERQALPLANDGWQMFQAPLFYLLAAPWYALLSHVWNEEFALKALRVLPLFCGLAQIELVYRVARAAFPTQAGLQMIATLVGGLMPMNVYLSQVVGNETLAGCLTSLVVLLCVLLLVDPAQRRGNWYFVGLGAVWGFALLAKATPLVLAPLLLATIVGYTYTLGDHWRKGLFRMAGVAGAAVAVAGWYYVRNLYYLGTPFTSGWGESSAEPWWQDPGYRTWEQLTSLGTALTQPVYSGCWSFGGSMYSTLCLDGFTSGQAAPPEYLPWNTTWMISGAWLGLLPTALILSGFLVAGRVLWQGQRPFLWFAAAAVLIYLAAIADRFLALPALCAAKSTYMLGVLPCLGLLAAAGAEPLVRHVPLRTVLEAALICWAVAVYVAYFSLAT